jgi:hypothetical protein
MARSRYFSVEDPVTGVRARSVGAFGKAASASRYRNKT